MIIILLILNDISDKYNAVSEDIGCNKTNKETVNFRQMNIRRLTKKFS